MYTYADTHYTQKLYIDIPNYSHTHTHTPITSIHTHRHTHSNMHIHTHRPKSVVLPLESDSLGMAPITDNKLMSGAEVPVIGAGVNPRARNRESQPRDCQNTRLSPLLGPGHIGEQSYRLGPTCRKAGSAPPTHTLGRK